MQTVTDGGGVRWACAVTVNASVPVTGIEVCPASKTMNVGETFTLCADVCPQNVVWCSSVATVGAHTGYVMAKKAVSATITATAIDGNGANDTRYF